MNDLLSSLKSDLLDRRLLPVLVLLGAVLVAAIAYAVLGGGSSSPAAPVASTGSAGLAPTATGPTLAVHEAPADPNAAVAETTDGSRYQHHGGAHNPFSPLASATAKSASTTSAGGSASAGKSSSSSSSSSSGSSAGSAGSSGAPGSGSGSGATPAEPTPAQPAPSKPQKPKTVYLVNVLYGLTPMTPGQLSQLTPFADVKRLEPLPSSSDPKVVFAGVSDTGKGAIFTLVGEAILKGEGSCMPSATQCEAVVLAPGKSEEFEYAEANGQTVSYELKVVNIVKREASAATAARLNRRDHAGAALMRHLAPAVLAHLRFSSAKGVLFYVAHHKR
jgi:hypothetical protein